MHAKERVPNRWLIASMCTVLQLCLGTVYAWSYFQPLLVEQFRWTNTETSWAFSLTICCLGLSAAWGGINLARMDHASWPSPAAFSSRPAMPWRRSRSR
jgi:OFA family oxalate/formate antiporter-like MFS transporter